MDFAHAVVRQLEAREWCELGLGPFGYTCGTTSPKNQGQPSYGPFQAALRRGCCTLMECAVNGERTYVFAMRTGVGVYMCRCTAKNADAYALDLRMLEDSWTRDVAPVLRFDTIGAAAEWMREHFGSVSEWRDKGLQYSYTTDAATCSSAATSDSMPSMRT